MKSVKVIREPTSSGTAIEEYLRQITHHGYSLVPDTELSVEWQENLFHQTADAVVTGFIKKGK